LSQDAKKFAKNSRSVCTIPQRCWAMSSQLRHVSTIGKKLLNSNIFSTCPHSMVNLGLLTAEIGWRVWGSQQNSTGFVFGFVTAPTSLNGGQPNCTMFGRLLGLYTIHTFWGYCPQRNFARCRIHFTSKSCVLLYWQRYCTALEQWVSVKLCGVRRGRHLYSAGWPSRWASAHILVVNTAHVASSFKISATLVVFSERRSFLSPVRRSVSL